MKRYTLHTNTRLKGAKCPACGYVYTMGFCDVDTHVKDEEGYPGGPLTPCTRCKRILQEGKTELRLLSETELLLLPAHIREHLEVINALLDLSSMRKMS
jgi:hypothetical protein